MLRLAQLIVVTGLALASRSEAQGFFDFSCLRGSASTCFVLFEGTIENGMVERFEAYVEEEGVEGEQLILNSPGGNLAEALKLGRLLRDWEWKTHVGSSEGWFRNPDGSLDLTGAEGFPQGGRCESACAYAFMGGVTRTMGTNSLLGFHRFQAPGQVIDGDSAQAISGQLISYIIEMGVDARVFVVASGEDSESMFHLNGEEAREFDLVTPDGFSPFSLFARDAGVVAVSERASSVGLYDLAEKVTLSCSQNRPMLTIHSSQVGVADGGYVSFYAGVDMNPEEFEFQEEFKNDDIRYVYSDDDDEAQFTAELSAEFAEAILGAGDVYLEFTVAPVDGGPLDLNLNPSDDDRMAMAAAWRFCIN